MVYLMEGILALLLFMMGACVFSFVNVVIYRVPKKLSFVKGYSACPSCGHRLYYKDMVPVFSWLFLHGRCRYCKDPVSARYTIIELIGGFLAVLTVSCFGFTASALLWFIFFCILTAITFVDIDTMEIPDGFVLSLLILAVIKQSYMGGLFTVSPWIGMVVVSVPMLLISLIIPGAFGGGDMKLMAVCGILLGWKLTLFVFFVGVLTGGGYSIVMLAKKKLGKKDHFAFGPFLCLGMMLAVFLGDYLITWYLGMCGL